MTNDLLDRLSESEVPPLPDDFDHAVHQRLNDVLSLAHCAEAMFRVLPYALGHLAQGLVGLLMFTMSGRYPTGSEDHTLGTGERP